MAKVKLEVLRFFSTYDASGVIIGEEGDKLEVGGATAKRLIKQGFAKKWRPKKKNRED